MSVDELILQGKQVFCSVPQKMGRVGLCQWPRHHTVTWNIVRAIPDFSTQDLQQIYKAGYDMWEAVCGIKFKYVSNPRAANIIVGSRDIDRKGGILAEHQLPCGNITATSQIQGWMDSSDSWTTATNWQQLGRFPILRVWTHETGHGMGIGHNQDGQINALMDPTVSHIDKPQAWDAEQGILRYDEPGGQEPEPENDFADLARALMDCLQRLDPKDIKVIKELLS